MIKTVNEMVVRSYLRQPGIELSGTDKRASPSLVPSPSLQLIIARRVICAVRWAYIHLRVVLEKVSGIM
jgi:hypothetical protein